MNTRRKGYASQGRLGVLALFAIAAYLLLGLRAAQLQAFDNAALRQRAERQHATNLDVEAVRGEIYDRNGVLLAQSATVYSLAASPARIEDATRTSSELAHVLGSTPQKIRRALRSDKSFVWLERWITDAEASQVRALELPGIELHPERKRFYPSRQLAAAYLGFAGRDRHGLSGIELAFERRLRGQDRTLSARRDARGRRLIALEDVAAAPDSAGGRRLDLTLDAKLQFAAENALARGLERTGAIRASLLALDPRSGDLLAIAQAPGFDPNQFWSAPAAAHKLWPLVDTFEPGSTLKPFTIAIALDAAVVQSGEMFDCENGSWRLGGRRIRDWKAYGLLPLHDVIRFSSNIGAAKIVGRVPATQLVDGLRRFGFGERTGSGFPGESAGILRDLSDRQLVERANLAFGQGLTVTSLQLASAAAALANDGRRVRPRLARSGNADTPLPTREPAISAASARRMRAMMRTVVESGTGSRAALPRHSVAGKTGTAQKVEHGRYSEDRFVASFLGMLPAGAPELVVVVVVDEAEQGRHTGGAAAAPIFREFAGFAVQHLGIAPE